MGIEDLDKTSELNESEAILSSPKDRAAEVESVPDIEESSEGVEESPPAPPSQKFDPYSGGLQMAAGLANPNKPAEKLGGFHTKKA